jgi:hypothetical protein
LAAIACGNRADYIASLAIAVFIAASKENFTEKMFQELHDSFRRLIESEMTDL